MNAAASWLILYPPTRELLSCASRILLLLICITLPIGTVRGRPAPYKQMDRAQSVAVDRAGDVIVTGFTRSRTFLEGYTAKYSGHNGALLWERKFGAAEEFSSGDAVVVDRNNDVTIAGVLNRGRGTGLFTARYRGNDGEIVWETVTHLEEGSRDEPSLLAVDAEGNVVITGSSSQHGSRAFTIKLGNTDGKPLWKKYLATQGRPSGLVIDSLGNVFVRCSSAVAGATYLTKYNGLDGALAWENTFATRPNWERPGRTLTLDAADSVTTVSSQGGIDSTLHVRKYAGADGKLLWEKSHSLAQPLSGALHGLLSGTHEDVFTYGEMSEHPGRGRLYVARYRGSDGERLWETTIQNSNGWAAKVIGLVGILAALASFGYGLIKRNRWHLAGIAILISVGLAGGVRSALDTEFRRRIWFTDAAIDTDGNLKTVTRLASGGHHIAKVAGLDGRILWQKWSMTREEIALTTPANLDRSSDIIVAGTSPSGHDNENIWIKKMRDKDGTTDWEIFDDAGLRGAMIDEFWTRGADREVVKGLTPTRFLYREIERKRATASGEYDRKPVRAISRARSIVHLTSVEFAAGQTVMSVEAQEALSNAIRDPLVAKILRLPISVFVVAEAVADSERAISQVSEHRAEAVSAALRSLGISQSIYAIGSAGVPRGMSETESNGGTGKVRIFVSLPRSSFSHSDLPSDAME
jgi:hypothetical protein